MPTEAYLTRDEKILEAKELYSQGSRSFLVKCFCQAADELSQVCSIYEEVYGALSDELGLPYLLYAKSLIALALEENKIIDVLDGEIENDDSNEDDVSELVKNETEDPTEFKQHVKYGEMKGESKMSSCKINTIREEMKHMLEIKEDSSPDIQESKQTEFRIGKKQFMTITDYINLKKYPSNGPQNNLTIADSERPSTSGTTNVDILDDESEESGLQLAWEILELAAKIFIRQGENGLPNLAEVHTELANIEFENNVLDCAREDYEKALKIYEISPNQRRRAMAEIHYKIGLIYVMQEMNKEGAESLKKACALIEDEIIQINSQMVLTEKENENMKDIKEIRQDICAKISEIEETRQQHISEVRAALDSIMDSAKKNSTDGSALSSTNSLYTKTPSSKPSDITYLIKRKKSNTSSSSSVEETELPVKRSVA